MDHRLTLTEVLKLLVADHWVSSSEAKALSAERKLYRGDAHPLVVIGEQQWKSLQPPHAVLTTEVLTEWLADKADLEYLHIDPLKIDFSSVTDVMSSAYAGRFKILPVGVTASEVVVATAEPFMAPSPTKMSR